MLDRWPASGWNVCRAIRRERGAGAGIVLALALVGCTGGREPQSADGREPRNATGGRLLHSEACSDIPVEKGEATLDWLVKGEQSSQSAPGISTSDLTPAPDGTFYVVDAYENRALQLTNTGRILRSWGRAGDGPGEFRRPTVISLGPEREIYVGSANGRISLFNRTGTLVRTFRVAGFVNVTGIIPLPGGQLAVSTDAHPGERRDVYVKIVDSLGKTIHDVLSLPGPGAAVSRPTLGAQVNFVRLADAGGGRFAVWYPMDNFVQIFDATGAPVATVVGCMPQWIQDHYLERRSSRGFQSGTTLTLGIAFDAPDRFRVASFDWTEKAQTVRVREYLVGRGEIRAQDIDITSLEGHFDRVAFASRTELFAFSGRGRERGILRIAIH